MLAIDLVDARRNAVVWRGVPEGRLSAQQRDPGAMTEAAVGEIFSGFPNGPKK